LPIKFLTTLIKSQKRTKMTLSTIFQLYLAFSYYYRGKLILCSTNFISSIPIFKTRRKIFRTIRFLVLTGPGPDLLGNFSTPGYKNMLIFFILFRGRRDHMVFGFTTTYAIISIVSWWSVLLVEETGVPG
jgi:hypothetical protein